MYSVNAESQKVTLSQERGGKNNNLTVPGITVEYDGEHNR